MATQYLSWRFLMRIAINTPYLKTWPVKTSLPVPPSAKPPAQKSSDSLYLHQRLRFIAIGWGPDRRVENTISIKLRGWRPA
jgi:hypothetical protein